MPEAHPSRSISRPAPRRGARRAPASGGTAYAELLAASNFSFLRGASHPEELAAASALLGLAGFAIADRNTLAGVVRGHLAARQTGVRYGVGCRLAFRDGTPDVAAWAPDRAAYGRLCRLLTAGNLRAEKGACHLDLPDLLEWGKGLELALLPGRRSPRELGGTLASLADSFPGQVRLGATCLHRGDDARRLAGLSRLARSIGVPLLALGDVLYHAPERRRLQDVLTCVREHVTLDAAGRRLEANAERHLRSGAEMARLFSAYPEALKETLAVTERLAFSLEELRAEYEYPLESAGASATPYDELVRLTWEGADRRYPGGVPDKVAAALRHELAIIQTLKYEAYFLTVWDIVRFARDEAGILCQGRGSAANSAVCYCLGVTDVDPDTSDLLFERFISPDRNEPPDIDVDFEHARREEVIQYIFRKYGADHTGIAATVITYRSRSAAREVGKAFGLSDDAVGALAGNVWGWSNTGVGATDARRAGLDPAERRIAQVLELAGEIIGFPRHLSQHVGGFVITRSRLDEVVPVLHSAMEGRTIIEWDKDDLEALGLLKVDVLALGMLTALKKGLDLLGEHYGMPLRLAAIPKEDSAVYDMICRADTIGVFQIESRAQMTMLPRLRPREFYDLVIEVAIVRPGPIQGDMVHPYLRRRQGLEEVHYPRPAPEHGDPDELKRVLEKTFGVPLFQEQAMRIAIVAAKFEPGEADKLRRAMATFRRVGTIGTFRTKMVEGMVGRGYERGFAERCFSQIEGFGEYGFPESHAASFALLVYASSWVKCHYPDVFCAALLNAQPMGFYAPAQLVRDAEEHGVEMRAVDVNFSHWDCTLEPSPPCGEGSSEPGSTFEDPSPRPSGPTLSPQGGEGLAPFPSPLWGGAESEPSSTYSPPPCGEGVGEGSSEPGSTFEDPSPRPSGPTLSPQGGEGSRRLVAPTPALPHKGGRSGAARSIHPRHAEQAGAIRTRHAVRLGFRQIKGMRQADADMLVAGRTRPYRSVRDLWLRSGMPRAGLERLAEADAFRSLGLDRRAALWAVRALDPGSAAERLPLFADAPDSAGREVDVALPDMPLGEHVVNDYRSLSLSLKAHPVAFLRDDLRARSVVEAGRLPELATGRRIAVAGLVLVRQRPGTAQGVIFATLEDETGVANIIIWPKIFERYRPVVLGARLLHATGRLQSEQGVIHLVAETLADWSPLLSRLSEASLGNSGMARADEVSRPTDERYMKVKPKSRLTRGLAADPELAAERKTVKQPVASAMPKGRNFH